MKAEAFRKNWRQENPNIIHIPSEHELRLMTEYAKCNSIQFSRWLLKNTEATVYENVLCWKFEGNFWNTDELYEIFIKL